MRTGWLRNALLLLLVIALAGIFLYMHSTVSSTTIKNAKLNVAEYEAYHDYITQELDYSITQELDYSFTQDLYYNNTQNVDYNIMQNVDYNITEKGDYTLSKNTEAGNIIAKPLATPAKYIASHSLCHIGGRLGNRMFEVAATVISAQENNATFVFINDPKCSWTNKLITLFPALSKVQMINQSLISKTKILNEKNFASYERIDQLDTSTRISGYRQSYLYFSRSLKQIDTIRQLFTPAANYREIAQNQLMTLKGKWNFVSPTLVAVHIRLGDLDNKVKEEVGYRLPKVDYYQQAFQEMSSRHKEKLVFIVGSDSIDKAEKMLSSKLPQKYNIEYLRGGTVYTDFTALTMCSHTIISVGTFGFWVGWISGGDVIYYSKHVREGTRRFKAFNNTDYFPESWIPLPN